MQRSLSSLSLDEELDNANTNWVGGKGTWCMYLLGIVTFRLTLHVCGVDRQTAWTVLNLSHAAFSFYYVHWLKGMPMFRSAPQSELARRSGAQRSRFARETNGSDSACPAEGRRTTTRSTTG